MEVGNRIRRRREELGLSRKALAAQLKTRDGKSQSSGKVAQWEQGVSLPTAARRGELADSLETTIGQLFGESETDGTLSRIDLVEARLELLERKTQAIITIEELGDAVEATLRSQRRKGHRRQATQRKLMQVAEEAPTRVRKSKSPTRKRHKGS